MSGDVFELSQPGEFSVFQLVEATGSNTLCVPTTQSIGPTIKNYLDQNATVPRLRNPGVIPPFFIE